MNYHRHHHHHHHHLSPFIITPHYATVACSHSVQSPAVVTGPAKYTLQFCTGEVMGILPRFPRVSREYMGINSNHGTAWMPKVPRIFRLLHHWIYAIILHGDKISYVSFICRCTMNVPMSITRFNTRCQTV